MSGLIDVYLAGPYSYIGSEPGNKRWIEAQRYRQLTGFAVHIMRNGLTCFSPISHSHPMLDYDNLPGDWRYWEKMDRVLMGVCNEVWVMCMLGYHQSHGVENEIKLAGKLGKRVRMIDPNYISIDDEIENYKRENPND